MNANGLFLDILTETKGFTRIKKKAIMFVGGERRDRGEEERVGERRRRGRKMRREK